MIISKMSPSLSKFTHSSPYGQDPNSIVMLGTKSIVMFVVKYRDQIANTRVKHRDLIGRIG